MGKSSPTKLQLKHIPDIVVLETVFFLQNLWTVWPGASGIGRHTIFSLADEAMPAKSLHYRKKKLANFYEIAEVLEPIPEKLLLAKLRKLERQGKLISYGPSSMHFKVELDKI